MLSYTIHCSFIYYICFVLIYTVYITFKYLIYALPFIYNLIVSTILY